MLSLNNDRASKTRLQILERGYDAEHGAPDLTDPGNGPDKIDITSFTDNTSTGIVDSLVANMSVEPTRYTLLHISEPDGAGHLGRRRLEWGSRW